LEIDSLNRETATSLLPTHYGVVGVGVVVVGVGVWWCGQSFNALQPFSTSLGGHLLPVIRSPCFNKNEIRKY
jgi:hypothetical protein